MSYHLFIFLNLKHQQIKLFWFNNILLGKKITVNFLMLMLEHLTKVFNNVDYNVLFSHLEQSVVEVWTCFDIILEPKVFVLS